jgi:hypothetical protein
LKTADELVKLRLVMQIGPDRQRDLRKLVPRSFPANTCWRSKKVSSADWAIANGAGIGAL